LGTLTLTACDAQQQPARDPSPRPLELTFSSSVSYAQALREVTAIGLPPGFMCGGFGDLTNPKHPLTYDALWQPQGQQARFAASHHLFVAHGPAEDPRWGVQQLPGVLSIAIAISYTPDYDHLPTPHPGAAAYVCHVKAEPVPAGNLVLAGSNASFPFLHVQFTRQTTYDEALATMSDLGIGLALPCYEEHVSLPRSGIPTSSVPWSPLGQEQPFAATHTLTVEPTRGLVSTQWRQQLTQATGVTSVQTYTPSC
ncbi:MAG TPA: hypothetical protein VKQ36_12365, partial [Ktedonobacterales bacterium]|nr:hypothetical protein [Ktedonobacterales bacterium]